MQVINPFSENISNLEEISTSELEGLFKRVQKQQLDWRKLSVQQRVAELTKALHKLAAEIPNLAPCTSQEMGKPLRAAQGELARSVDEFTFLLARAVEWLADENVAEGFIRYDPLGVVAVISPWNFPFMLPLRAIVPALLAGNGVIFKPSELTPLCGQKLFQILSESAPKLPLGLALGGKEIGAQVVKLPIALVAFTGSTNAGKQIMRSAAENIKRVLLELGGLDAAIVLSDADLPLVAKDLVTRNVFNSGQVCNAVKRVYVEQSAYPTFVELAKQALQKLVCGDPLDDKTDLGPLVSKGQLLRAQEILADAIKLGARAVSASATLPEHGFFMAPTILLDVPAQARVLNEEPFAPILPIIPFTSVEQAIAAANETRFGLTASVWSGDRQRALQIASMLEVGLVGINNHLAGPPGTPWGGNKESGLGRLKTRTGLHEFCNVKYVHIK